MEPRRDLFLVCIRQTTTPRGKSEISCIEAEKVVGGRSNERVGRGTEQPKIFRTCETQVAWKGMM